MRRFLVSFAIVLLSVSGVSAATLIFRGDAPKIAKVVTYAFAGTLEATDKVRAQFGTNGHYYDFTVGSTSNTTAAATVATAWNALSSTVYPEFAEITATSSGTTFQLTMDTAGRDFSCYLTPLETDGSGSDAQTIESGTSATLGTTATANSGPNDWGVAANWSTAATPTTGDTVILENSNVDILYGLSQSAVTLSAFIIRGSYSGKLGNNQYNTAGTQYREYRPTHLAISSTTCEIGSGDGQGSGLIRIAFGSNANVTTVWNTSASVESGSFACNITGSHANNKLYAYGGSVSVAQFGGQTSRYPVVGLNGAIGAGRAPTVWLGSGVTADEAVTQSAGSLFLNAGSASLVCYGGKATLNAGAHPIITAIGGEVVVNTADTIGATSITVGSTGVLDFDQSVLAKTSSLSISAHKGATIKNANGSASQAVITPVGCRQEDLKLTTPVGKSITFGS